MKWKEIVTNANTVKKGVEKNGEMPTIKGYSTAQLCYIFGEAVRNPKKNVADRKVAPCPDCTGSAIDRNLTRNEYQKLAKYTNDWIRDRGVAPNYTSYQNYMVSIRLQTYCYAKIIVWYDEHSNTLPLTCWFKNSVFKNTSSSNKTSSKTTTTSTSDSNIFISSPHYTEQGCNKLGQCTPYYCAPHSIHQGLKKFGITQFSESQLASWCGTTTSGTSHNGIHTCIAKVAQKTGKKLTVKEYNFSELGSWKKVGQLMSKSNVFVIFHLWYSGAGSYVDDDACGHYEMLQKINLNTNYCKALNSLGSRCGGSTYCGHLQDRKLSVQRQYMNGISQKSIIVVTMG